MTETIDLKRLLMRASTDPALRERATIFWSDDLNTKALFNARAPRNGAITISDCGRCALELWADVHEHLDIELDPITQITRFDIGTLYGAWIAALIAAGLTDERPNLRCSFEQTVWVGDVSGHVDILVFDPDLGKYVWVIEIKSTYYTKEIDPPHTARMYQVLQAGSYASAAQAPIFTVLTIGPSVHAYYSNSVGAKITPDKIRQDDYYTEYFDDAVHAEMGRLKGALNDQAPQPDATEVWRCASCRYGACSMNVNPLAQKETVV